MMPDVHMWQLTSELTPILACRFRISTVLHPITEDLVPALYLSISWGYCPAVVDPVNKKTSHQTLGLLR